MGLPAAGDDVLAGSHRAASHLMTLDSGGQTGRRPTFVMKFYVEYYDKHWVKYQPTS